MYIHYRKVGKTGGGIAEEREAGREEEYILVRASLNVLLGIPSSTRRKVK